MIRLDIKQIQSMQISLMEELHKFLIDNNIKYYMIGGSALGAIRHKGFIPWDDDIDLGMFRLDYEKFLSIADKFKYDCEIVNFHTKKNCDYALTRIYFNSTFIKNDNISNTKLDVRLFLDIFPIDNVADNINEKEKVEKKIAKYKRLIQLVDFRKYNNNLLKNVGKKVISWFLTPFRNVILKKFEINISKFAHDNTKYVCSYCSQYSFERQTMLKNIYGEPKLMQFEKYQFYVPEKTEDYLEHLFGADYMNLPPENKRRIPMEVYLLSDSI